MTYWSPGQGKKHACFRLSARVRFFFRRCGRKFFFEKTSELKKYQTEKRTAKKEREKISVEKEKCLVILLR